MNAHNTAPKWREIDTKAVPKAGAIKPGEALRAVAGFGGKNGADIRAALSGGSGGAGGFTLPDDMFDEIVTLTSQQMAVVQAGARVIELMHDDVTIPRLSGLPTPAWRLENGAIAESDPVFSASKLTPKSLALIFKVSRELLEDGFDIDLALANAMTTTMAYELDRVTMRGSGSAGEPLGLLTGRPFIEGTVAPSPVIFRSYKPFVSMCGYLKQKKQYAATPNAVLLSGPLATYMEAATDGNMQPLQRPEALKDVRLIPCHGLNAVAGETVGLEIAVAGQWDQMVIGWRGGIRIEQLRERYADTGQVGFVVHARMGMELLNPHAFNIERDLKPALIGYPDFG